MSLINDVLRDLDRRHANAADRAGLPGDVRPLPPQPPRWRVSVMALALLAASAGLGGALWVYNQNDSESPPRQPPVPASAVPQPLTSDAALPAQTISPAPATNVAVVPETVVSAPATDKVAVPATLPKNHVAPVVSVSPSKPAGSVALKLSPDIQLPMVERAATSPSSPPSLTDKGASLAANDGWVKAQTAIKRGQIDEAELLLKQVLDAQPELLAPRQALLSILLSARRYAEALVVLKAGLVHHPEQTSWAMNLARLQVDAGSYPAAWESLSASIAHAQQQPEYLAFAGTILQRLDKPVDATSHYQAALRLRPEEARWWVGLGIALESAGHPAEARVAFQRAKSIGNVSPEMTKFIDQKLQ